MQKYNISRITVTRAINELVAEDYLYRIKVKGPSLKENSYLKVYLNFQALQKNEGKSSS